MLTGKYFLIIITLTETRSVFCERAGVPEPMASCWITALKRRPGHHTLAEAREPTTEGVSFQARESDHGQGIHTLSFLQASEFLRQEKRNRSNVTTIYYLHLLFLEGSKTTTSVLLGCQSLCMISETREGIYLSGGSRSKCLEDISGTQAKSEFCPS